MALALLFDDFQWLPQDHKHFDSGWRMDARRVFIYIFTVARRQSLLDSGSKAKHIQQRFR